MACQIGFAAERASAEKADKRTFAGVLANVQFEVFLGAHTFAAEWTCKAAAKNLKYRQPRLLVEVSLYIVISSNHLRSRCFSAASTRRKFRIDASCGLSPSACSLGIRSALMSDVMVDVDGIDGSLSMECMNRGCWNTKQVFLVYCLYIYYWMHKIDLIKSKSHLQNKTPRIHVIIHSGLSTHRHLSLTAARIMRRRHAA